MGRRASKFCRMIGTGLSIFLWFVCNSAGSSELPPVVEEYRLLSSEWEVRSASTVSSNETYYLSASHNGRTFVWKIEPGWIAQSLKGNDVPANQLERLTVNHVQSLIGKKGDLIFKVASLTQDGELFVRSLKVLNLSESFEKASKMGSPILNMESYEVRKLGFAAYCKRVGATTDKEWERVEARKPKPSK